MMEKEGALELIDRLGGDEHSWVDYKEDYEVGGINSKKAEFLKDIASMANTLTDKDAHYILVGVNDGGNLVGISDGREEYRGAGPRHIYSFDGASLQQTVDSNLAPGPEIDWFTFEMGSDKFGVLEIEPLDNPPCVTIQNVDENDERCLHKGVIYTRKSSGKKVAGREEIQNIIEYRISKQRDQILEGVNKAVQIGPEWIDRLSQALPDEGGVPVAGTSPEEADIEVTQRLTREPATSLDEQLNEDIAQWKYRGDDFVGAKPLWEYYSSPNELNLDNTAIKFLTQASIKNHVLGGFWLAEADPRNHAEILIGNNLSHHRAERAAATFLLLDSREGFDKLMEKSRTNANYGFLMNCKRKFGNTISDRLNFILKDKEYNLQHETWRDSFDVRDFDPDEIRVKVPDVAEQLVDIQSQMDERPSLGGRLEGFRNALRGLEAVYIATEFQSYRE
jgi:hypothetical protein